MRSITAYMIRFSKDKSHGVLLDGVRDTGDAMRSSALHRSLARTRAFRLSAVGLATLSFFVLAGSAAAATTPAPSVSGAAEVGQTLMATPVVPGDSVEWFTCDSAGDISNMTPLAAGDDYQLQETDFGTYVCAVESVGILPTYESTAQGPITDSVRAAPTISGTFEGGQTLTASDVTWEQSGYTIGYQWEYCEGTSCTAIPGTTGQGQTYTLTAADVGKDVEVQETPIYDGSPADNAAVTSDAADTVAAPPAPPPAPAPHTSGLGAPGNTTAPSLTGVTQLGQTLTAKPGSWTNDPTSYDDQWQRCAVQCVDIPGATLATYQLALDDVGDTITVKVTAANATGGATATSSRSPEVMAPSAVQIVASPSSPLVNQPVTLVGIVSSGAQGTDPSGTVAFDDAGQPVPGCAGVAVPASGQTVTVSCVTSFPVSAPTLSAAFSPASSSPLLGSSSTATGISVLRGYSTTSLDASSETERGASTTYTASIAAAMDLTGPVLPAGTVTFLDHGKAISGCRAAPIKDAGATCTVRYAQAGGHSITARYDGDADFRGSVSHSRTVRVTVAPSKRSKVLGRITATMQWTFHYTPSYTRIIELVLYGAHRGSTVTINCTGRGCPFKAHSRTVARQKRCRSTRAHACPAPGTIDLGPSFHRRDLRAHVRVTVTVTRGRYVGKYYRFTIRPRKQPLVDISCLAAGSSTPGVGCTRH
jgi:hypothetical protein